MPKKKGRPKIKIKWDDFDKLCAMQCTLKEIASWFHCSEDTIEARVKEVKEMLFSEYFEQKKGKGRIALRRLQWETANSGEPRSSTTMQIFLGKNWLKQTDKLEGSIAPETLSAMFEKLEAKLKKDNKDETK